MYVSFRVKTIKIVVAIVVAVALAGVGTTLLISGAVTERTAVAAASDELFSTTDMVIWLASKGVSVEEEPILISEIIIPSRWNDFYTAYNDLQISQGYNLEKYRSKPATLYSFEVTNYLKDGEILPNIVANILLYENKVIATDISNNVPNGFVDSLDSINQ